MTSEEYWKEAICCAADEIGLELTETQVSHIAASVDTSHENYGLAFYSPSSDRGPSQKERELQDKCKRLEKELEEYRVNANTAVKQALGVRQDAQVSIHEFGEVLLHGGRTERIQ